MPSYHPITLEEAWEFLVPQGFIKTNLPGVKEIVFSKRVDKDGLPLSLRVYTGINPDGNSRTVGADAIRCVLFWRMPDGVVKKIATSKRVHRVEGWKDNLQNRIETLKPGPRCQCGAPMVLRGTKKYGEFYGCASYPVCKQTKEKK